MLKQKNVSLIKYLGVIISENKVQMDKEKLSGVLEWPVLTKVKQVQAFLGFANFYRRFIENFAKMSKCYESPREERVSLTFKHLISNIKSYNRVKI